MAFLPCKSFPSSLPQNCTHNSGPIHSLFTSLFFLFDYTEIIRFCVKDHRVKVPFSLYDIKGPYNQRYLWYLMLSHLGEGVFVRCLLCTVTLFSPLSTLYSLEGCPIQNWHLRNKKNCVHCAFDWSIYKIHFEIHLLSYLLIYRLLIIIYMNTWIFIVNFRFKSNNTSFTVLLNLFGPSVSFCVLCIHSHQCRFI